MDYKMEDVPRGLCFGNNNIKTKRFFQIESKYARVTETSKWECQRDCERDNIYHIKKSCCCVSKFPFSTN
uniref:Uncharacterized protein n=1 Tax=Rhizophora mucronata TaxID=61149 RepID=A0A2P2R3N3_RHIMU